ncbi:hypothetical protein A2U01_0022309 [Trifolium medium]|uniref:Uncharacterized protein n=1 Tax=Trifolium medium TaxID=97028 RepID=A0A392NPH1_9FABA|nr:hypothetical protein [Trifolium medium]
MDRPKRLIELEQHYIGVGFKNGTCKYPDPQERYLYRAVENHCGVKENNYKRLPSMGWMGSRWRALKLLRRYKLRGSYVRLIELHVGCDFDIGHEALVEWVVGRSLKQK